MRKAFTLIELIVVIAIIAVLVALILPAVQMIRAAAYRAVCTNNLKQIALACAMYWDSNGYLPCGCIRPAPAPAPMPPELYPTAAGWWSWSVRVFPYLEQNIVPDYTRPPWYEPIASVRVNVFICPSDPQAGQVYTLFQPIQPTWYLGVSGTDQFAFDGLLFVNSRVRDVPDGRSNTLLVGERPPTADDWFGWLVGGGGTWPYFGTCDLVLGVAEREEPNSQPETFRPGNNETTLVNGVTRYTHLRHFWSYHSGGGHFAFADGHVSFALYGAGNLRALATRDGAD